MREFDNAVGLRVMGRGPKSGRIKETHEYCEN